MSLSGWISKDLGPQIWLETEDASRLATKVRGKRKWQDAGGEGPNSADELSMLARYDPVLQQLLSSRPTPLFKLVAKALMHPQIQPPVDVFDLMDNEELAKYLKDECRRHRKKEVKRKKKFFDVLQQAKEQWRNETANAREEIGMTKPEALPASLDITAATALRLAQTTSQTQSPALHGMQRWSALRAGTPQPGTECTTLSYLNAPAKVESKEVQKDKKRARSLSPELDTSAMEVFHNIQFKKMYREKVNAILEQLSQLKCCPVTVERLDLGSRQSLLVVEIRKSALYGVINSVLFHLDEPLISVKAQQRDVPKITKTHSVIRGYENRSITFLTRPEEDQVRKEVQTLLDWPSHEGLRQKELDWKVRLVMNHRPVSDALKFKRFHWQAITPFAEFCPKGTVDDCIRDNVLKEECDKIHFRRLIFAHTDIELGDCSYLDTCRRLNICKFVHYQLLPSRALIKKLKALQGTDIEMNESKDISTAELLANIKGLPTAHWQNDYRGTDGRIKPMPVGMRSSPWLQAQWIQCDVRIFDLNLLGKFDVIMADPPWDIHMELPYGTMRDDEMRDMPVGKLSDEGLIFLWVTGRAMELGRECLELWGYRIMEEIVWVKINQLQRIIRTGRTGHWLNHSKEHCLVGIKGNPKINKCLDCDVIVSEVRETSRKPDEIYGMIERICPDGRKLEIFARNHNIHEGWISLGNQLDGVHLTEPQLLENYNNWVAKEMLRRKKETKEKELPRPAQRQAEPQQTKSQD